MRLAQLILFSGDVVRLRDFYVGALGLTVIEEEPGWIRLESGGVVLALHALRGEVGTAAAAGDGAAVAREDSYWKPCFHAEDVEAARTGLIAAGATMREVRRFGDVAFCDGNDPDGNVFQVTTR
jgi:catechol 2,3-dioxygenase-like lactoylglutathione lyase family enzyme